MLGQGLRIERSHEPWQQAPARGARPLPPSATVAPGGTPDAQRKQREGSLLAGVSGDNESGCRCAKHATQCLDRTSNREGEFTMRLRTLLLFALATLTGAAVAVLPAFAAAPSEAKLEVNENCVEPDWPCWAAPGSSQPALKVM